MEENIKINKIDKFLKVYKFFLVILYVIFTFYLIYSLVNQYFIDIKLSKDPNSKFEGLGLGLTVSLISIIIGGIGYLILEVLFISGLIITFKSKTISFSSKNKNKVFFICFSIFNIVTYVINVGLGLLLLELFKIKTK